MPRLNIGTQVSVARTLVRALRRHREPLLTCGLLTTKRRAAAIKQVIEAKKKLAAALTDSDKQFYERFCDKLDRDIDDLVYQLYDITPEERKIIEAH